MTIIKNIQTLAPFLADTFIDFPEPGFNMDKYNEFLQERESKLGLFSKYLVCKLHDSWVIETNLTDEQFSITLDDFSTYLMAYAIIDRFTLPIDPDHISFPLTLSFDTNLVVSYHTVDDDGNLCEVPPVNLDEYLYEQVITVDDDKVEIVFHFWKLNLNKLGEPIIVIVSAKNISLTENQDTAWHQLLGKKYDHYYAYFRQEFDGGRFACDDHSCLEIINEVDKNSQSLV